VNSGSVPTPVPCAATLFLSDDPSLVHPLLTVRARLFLRPEGLVSLPPFLTRPTNLFSPPCLKHSAGASSLHRRSWPPSGFFRVLKCVLRASVRNAFYNSVSLIWSSRVLGRALLLRRFSSRFPVALPKLSLRSTVLPRLRAFARMLTWI